MSDLVQENAHSRARFLPAGLPIPRNAFFGRDAEVSQLVAALGAPGALVSVLGPPGNGKTRLALEVAGALATEGRDIVFLDLRDVASIDDLLLQLASAANASGGFDELGRALMRRGVDLLFLDNVEHLVPTAPRAIEALRAGLGPVPTLITSRERLGVAAERRLHLEHLRLPAEGEDPGQSPAVALFLDRAGPLGGPPDLGEVASIVRRLEGSPLAIELCAMRASLIGPAALLAELERGSGVIRGRRPPAGGRFRSLEAALDHSFALLGTTEREALLRFSFFRGGFDLDAARALWDELEELHPLLDVLESLRDRSLLRVSARHRYSLYESVREFAAARVPDATRERVRALHSAHFLRGAVDVHRFVRRHHDRDTQARLLAESGNLLSIERAARAADPPELDVAMSAILRLRPLYLARGPFEELVRMVESVLDAHGEVQAEDERALLLLVTLGEAEVQRGRLEVALASLRAVRVLSADGAPHLRAYVLTLIGGIQAILQRPGESMLAFDEARRILASSPAAHLEAYLSEQLAVSLLQQDLSASERHLERALLVVREGGDERGQAHVLGFLATCRLGRGALEAAESAAREAIALAEAMGDRRWAACGRGVIGLVMQERGEAASARALLESALAAFEEIVNPWLEGIMRMALGELALEEGDNVRARRLLERVLEVERARGDKLSTAWSLGALCAVASREGELEEARLRLDEALEIAASLEFEGLDRALAIRSRELEVGRTRRAAQAGEPDTRCLLGLADGLREARSRGTTYLVRLAARQLEEEIGRASGGLLPSLRLGVDVEYFEIGSAPRVSLIRRSRMRNLLRALAGARRERPGQYLSVDELFAAGWPGERALARAATNRVHVTMTRLRKLGLEPLLESGVEGVRLRREATITYFGKCA